MGWESAQAALLLTHPPNPKLSGPTGQRWTCQDPAALRVQAAARWPQPQWQGPPSSRLGKGGAGPRMEAIFGQAAAGAARQFFSMACSLGGYCPFLGLWPPPSKWGTVHLASEALGSKFLQSRSQMQFTGILFGQCRTWILNSGLVSRFHKGRDFIQKSTHS